jgi:hypothetical protein
MTRFARFACWTLAVVAVFVVGWAGWWMWLAHDFDARVEELRAAGQPVAPADLAPPPIRDEDNAAPLLLEADAWYEARHDSRVPAVIRNHAAGEQWTDDDWRDAEEWLAGASGYVEMLESAVRRRTAQFDLRWEDGVAMEVPSVAIGLHAAEVLHAAALVAAHRGRLDRAVDHVETLLGLGDLLGRPFALTYETRQHLHAYALQTLEETARGRPVDAARVRARLEARLRNLEDPARLADVLRAERACALDAIRRWIAGESPRRLLEYYSIRPVSIADEAGSGFSDSLWSSFVMRPFAYRDGIALLDLMEGAIAACA